MKFIHGIEVTVRLKKSSSRQTIHYSHTLDSVDWNDQTMKNFKGRAIEENKGKMAKRSQTDLKRKAADIDSQTKQKNRVQIIQELANDEVVLTESRSKLFQARRANG